ncbi:LPS biosynthesis protein [Deltaproteobacteria bacterium]|nr:LPS biosynthesis protein [Deltaproteobacteria bacterium]
MLSAVIIAKDEADRIEAAVRSVAFADEVLVVDSGSADATVARAEAAGARVVQTDWPGFVAQKNRAWALARGEWVLSIDADEAVSAELQTAIRAAVASPAAEGFEVKRKTRWLGHDLAHGFAFPDPRVRLARKDRARWEGIDPHDHLVVAGSVAPLQGILHHDPYRSFEEHLRTIDRYTALDARRGSWLDVLARPPWHFIRGYLLKGGFRDGWPGLAFAALGATYTFTKWSRGHWDP